MLWLRRGIVYPENNNVWRFLELKLYASAASSRIVGGEGGAVIRHDSIFMFILSTHLYS